MSGHQETDVVVHEHYHYYIPHGWIAHILRKFNTDPRVQYKIHIFMTYVWIINMIVALCVYKFAPGFWREASILYLVLVSLYANFATDFGAVPGAEAAISAQDISVKVTTTNS